MKSPDRNGKVIKITTDKNKLNKSKKEKEFQASIQKNLQQVYFDSLKQIDDLLNDDINDSDV